MSSKTLLHNYISRKLCRGQEIHNPTIHVVSQFSGTSILLLEDLLICRNITRLSQVSTSLVPKSDYEKQYVGLTLRKINYKLMSHIKFDSFPEKCVI